MSDVKDFIKLVHQTSEEEKRLAYEQSTDIIKMLVDQGDQSDEDMIHYVLFRTCLLDIKITHLLTLVLEAKK